MRPSPLGYIVRPHPRRSSQDPQVCLPIWIFRKAAPPTSRLPNQRLPTLTPFFRRRRLFRSYRPILCHLLRPPIRPHSRYRGIRFSIRTGRVSTRRAPTPLPLPMLPIRHSITDTIRTQRRCNFIEFFFSPPQPVPAAHPLKYCFRSIVPPLSLNRLCSAPARFVNVLSCSVTLA